VELSGVGELLATPPFVTQLCLGFPWHLLHAGAVRVSGKLYASVLEAGKLRGFHLGFGGSLSLTEGEWHFTEKSKSLSCGIFALLSSVSL